MEGGPHSILYYREGRASDKTLSTEWRRKFIGHILAAGAEPVVVRGMDRFNEQEETVLPDKVVFEEKDGEQFVRTIPFDEPIPTGATSIRAFGKNLDPFVEETGAVVLNTKETSKLSAKDLVAEMLLDFQPATMVLDPYRFREQLDEIVTDEIVLKPIRGRGRDGLLIASKADIMDPNKYRIVQTPGGLQIVSLLDPAISLNIESSNGYLLQESVDTSQPFPSSIYVLDSLKDLYEAKKNFPKEVRLMVYWDVTRKDEQKIIPFARIFTPKPDTNVDARTKRTHYDNYLLVDIEKSLPPELDAMSQEVVKRMLEFGKTQYLYGSIDVAYDGKRWYVIELNVWFPGTPNYEVARQAGAEDLADVHHKSLATLMANAATDRAGINTIGHRTPRLDI